MGKGACTEPQSLGDLCHCMRGESERVNYTLITQGEVSVCNSVVVQYHWEGKSRSRLRPVQITVQAPSSTRPIVPRKAQSGAKAKIINAGGVPNGDINITL